MAMHSLLSSPSPFTHTAQVDGAWDQASTWEQAEIPSAGAVVHVPEGKKVTVTHQDATGFQFIQVDGRLHMSPTADTRLMVETLSIGPSGFFRIGNLVNPVRADKSAEVVFISSGQPIDTSWDEMEQSRGLVSHGRVRLFGQPKDHMITMPHSLSKEGNVLDTGSAIPPGWAVGDQVVITCSYFQRGNPSQDETANIIAISGSSLTIDKALQFDHMMVRSDMHLHIANLTRNVILRSQSTNISDRGHVMFLNSNVRMHNVALIDVGRTNKAIPLDEIIVDTVTGEIAENPDIQNRRGRYAVHFHLNGSDPGQPPPSQVYGCVVTGTPGWGFVNHSSHVDFQRNVCYDFVGAAFVTEAGNELGNFTDNIAIRGTGNGEHRPIRIVYRNLERPQPLSDFGFSGDGFWFQGPAIRARNNIASGCTGTGMMWFTTGAVDIAANRYIGFPSAAVPEVYPQLDPDQLRRWSGDSSVIISDLPILECDGFEAYGCLVGLHLRFNNHNNVAWYKEGPYNFARDIQPVPGHELENWWADRTGQTIRNLKLWNNEIGFRVRYNTQTDWFDVTVVNRQDYGQVGPVVGAEITQAIEEEHFTNLEIDGYEVAGLIETIRKNARNKVTFDGQTYLNYASFDTWLECLDPVGVSADAGSESAQITWTKDNKADRRLLRYRVMSETQWQYASVEGRKETTIVLTGLTAGKTYEFQLIAGSFTKDISNWTPLMTFTTLPV